MTTRGAQPLPILVLTGFLGSGKTTLLRALLGHPGFAQTAVLVNELGEIGIDHMLVQHVAEELVLLESGCLCCTLRGDLVEQLTLLSKKRASGAVPPFARVVLETTGLADPAPILATLLSHPALADAFYVDGVITTVDAEHGLGCIERYAECRKQISVADRIVITKVDRASEAEVRALRGRVQELAPGVGVRTAVMGGIEPREIFGVGHLDTRGLVDAHVNPHEHVDEHAHDHDHDHDHVRERGREGHTRVESIAVTLERPVNFSALSWWVSLTTQLYGEHILRLKAVVSAAGEATPIAVQAVQHVVYPPLNLPAMPELGGKSHIVVLTTGLEPAQCEQMRASLRSLDGTNAGSVPV